MAEFWDKLRQIITISGTRGFYFPHVFDAAKSKPSITLLFNIVSFGLAAGSILALHLYASLLTATGVSIAFFVICYALSMFKGVDKLDVNLTERSVKVENDPSNDEDAK